ncbi:MAG: site-specific integrase [Eubacteriales bacterium]|nr:site-specific integrase [Eubacteriales bacterium]
MGVTPKKDKNGTYYVQYRKRDIYGNSIKTTKRGFKTKKEAEKWYARFLLQQSSSMDMLFKDFWELYMEDMSSRLKITTLKQKQFKFKKNLLPYFGNVPMNKITVPMIRKWQNDMMALGYKPTTLKTINNELHAIMKYAVDYYDLGKSPCDRAGSMGKSKADERPHWSYEEFSKFIEAVVNKQDAWLGFNIIYWTGVRVGELLALRVSDIDFENSEIRIDETRTVLDGEELIDTPKTDSSVRVIKIHEELLTAIREYIDALYKPKPDTLLFAAHTKRFFEHEMDRGIKISGVKRITVHDLRHSHASLLLKMGHNFLEISKRLGHGSVRTTIETYCHAAEDSQERIADSLGKLDRGDADGV